MQPLRGIALKLCAVMLFIIMLSLVKAVSADVPAGQSVFFRSFFAIPVIVVWLLLRGELSIGLRVRSRMGHFWRGVIGTIAMGLNFAAVGFLPLPEVTAISFTAPLLTVLLAALLLGETVRMFRLCAVALGLIGVLVVIEPRLTVFSSGPFEPRAAFGVGLVLLGAGFIALAHVHIRKLTLSEHPAAIVFYFSLTSTSVALCTLPFGWVLPSMMQTVLLVLIGLIGGVAQIFLTLAYRFAPASVVAPFEYTAMLFSLLIGYVFFNELPTLQMLIGAGIIIMAGLVIILREAQLGLKRGAAKAVKPPA